jgi:D-glycerate 3-kinase
MKWSLENLYHSFKPILPANSANELKINFYYLPLLTWIMNIFSQQKTHPIFIGINGPQGSGKSTLTKVLVKALNQLSIQAISISIDDFYLTNSQQVDLAQRYPTNSLLQQRGYPGTHDIALGVNVLNALKNSTDSSTVHIPVYNKSSHQGQGDRAAENLWHSVRGIPDIVFFEGWMLGFTPVKPNCLPNDNFHVINKLLTEYKVWYSYLNAFIQLFPSNIQYISHWRVEAEANMKALGKAGMSDEEIKTYIEKFIPAYQIYLPHLVTNPPVAAHLRILIGENRLPVF